MKEGDIVICKKKLTLKFGKGRRCVYKERKKYTISRIDDFKFPMWNGVTFEDTYIHLNDFFRNDFSFSKDNRLKNGLRSKCRECCKSA